MTDKIMDYFNEKLLGCAPIPKQNNFVEAGLDKDYAFIEDDEDLKKIADWIHEPFEFNSENFVMSAKSHYTIEEVQDHVKQIAYESFLEPRKLKVCYQIKCECRSVTTHWEKCFPGPFDPPEKLLGCKCRNCEKLQNAELVNPGKFLIGNVILNAKQVTKLSEYL